MASLVNRRQLFATIAVALVPPRAASYDWHILFNKACELSREHRITRDQVAMAMGFDLLYFKNSRIVRWNYARDVWEMIPPDQLAQHKRSAEALRRKIYSS